jgi:ABC-2 type transport system permease protein
VLRDVADVLPLTHLINGLSGAMVHGRGLGAHGVALLVLALWAIAGITLAVRGFSWEARRG